jgi:hypothetical protein
MSDLIDIVNWDEVKKVVDNAKFHHEKYGDVVIFTNANEWYIPTLIKNLHKSMQIHEPDKNLVVLCTDREGYDLCGDLGYKHYAFVDIPLMGVSEFKNLYGKDDIYIKYTKLCFVKTVIMRYMLESGYTPLYIDPDMSLNKPSVENLLGYLENVEIVVAGNTSHINTNIMIARPDSEKCKKLYRLSLSNLKESINLRLPSGDEPYTSTRILFVHKIPYVCVKPEEHPGGNDNIKYSSSAYTFHANCVSGLKNKINLLKSCGGWYLPKVCIATLAVGQQFLKRYTEIFEPSHISYAKKYNYDRKVITDYLDDLRDMRALTMNKILVCNCDWAQDYDYIVILDGDIVINKNSPPIEYAYDYGDKIGVVCEFSPDVKSNISFRTKLEGETPSKYYLRSTGEKFVTNHLINTGMLVVQPKKHKKFLNDMYEKFIGSLIKQPKDYYNYEQAIIGMELQKKDMCIFMSNNWNSVWYFAKTYYKGNVSLEEYLKQVSFLHLAGCCDHFKVPKI